MSSAGHVLDMINRIKQNISLKEAKKARYAKVKGIYHKHLSKHMAAVDKNHLPDAELNLLKQKIRRKIKNDRVKATIITVLVLVLVTGIVLFSIYQYIQ